MGDSFAISTARQQFRDNYFKSLLISVPFIINILINMYVIEALFEPGNLFFGIITFIISGIASFYTYRFSLIIVRDDYIDSSILKMDMSIIYFFIYQILILGIQSLITEQFGELSVALIFNIVEPFMDFVLRAETSFGFALRLMIALDMILIPTLLITYFLVHRFFMIPYYIVDGENVLEAVEQSWSNTSGNSKSIIQVFMILSLFALLALNLILLVVFVFVLSNPTSLAMPKFLNVFFVLILALYYVPYFNLVLANLFEEM